jgi:ribosomal protein L12E/L44/L45/RPP1/RPP2
MMTEDVILYEAGLRVDSVRYWKFIQSIKESDVDEYITIMKKTKPEESTIVKTVKHYRCISTTPFIIGD